MLEAFKLLPLIMLPNIDKQGKPGASGGSITLDVNGFFVLQVTVQVFFLPTTLSMDRDAHEQDSDMSAMGRR